MGAAKPRHLLEDGVLPHIRNITIFRLRVSRKRLEEKTRLSVNILQREFRCKRTKTSFARDTPCRTIRKTAILELQSLAKDGTNPGGVKFGEVGILRFVGFDPLGIETGQIALRALVETI